MLTIAVDAMGGDFGLKTTLPACITFLNTYKDVHILLVGNQEYIKEKIEHEHKQSIHFLQENKIRIQHTEEFVAMDDALEIALRKKRKSSMRLAIECVKQNQADVCVSSGNTAALMALSHYVLKNIKGIDRPAIVTTLPNQKNTGTVVLDLGANADCTANHLLQFAHMASIMLQLTKKIDHLPSIGLLNIGEEMIKGNEVVKQAAKLLKDSNLNFYGNVEGNDIFKGTTDIVVCDGFAGNIALKAAEGVAKMISTSMKQSFNANLFTKLSALIAYPVLKKIRYAFDHRRYNGAILLGLNGLVVKSHGGADEMAFFHALEYAYTIAKQNTLTHIKKYFDAQYVI
jgi:phosphate acyltransferase